MGQQWFAFLLLGCMTLLELTHVVTAQGLVETRIMFQRVGKNNEAIDLARYQFEKKLLDDFGQNGFSKHSGIATWMSGGKKISVAVCFYDVIMTNTSDNIAKAKDSATWIKTAGGFTWVYFRTPAPDQTITWL